MLYTIYAVCLHCAHVDPRPLHAEEDWMNCEACHTHNPELYTDHDGAEDRSQEIIDEIGTGPITLYVSLPLADMLEAMDADPTLNAADAWQRASKGF